MTLPLGQDVGQLGLLRAEHALDGDVLERDLEGALHGHHEN
jgi:hypothetical protein